MANALGASETDGFDLRVSDEIEGKLIRCHLHNLEQLRGEITRLQLEHRRRRRRRWRRRRRRRRRRRKR